MPRLDRYFSQGAARTAPLPRADARALADTGQGIEAEGLIRAGQGLTDVAGVVLKYHEREGNSQYDAGRGTAYSLEAEFKRTNFNNIEEFDAGYETLENNLKNVPFTNSSGKRKYSDWLSLHKGRRESARDEKKIRMVAANSRIDLFKGLTGTAQIEDQATAISEINTLVEGGLNDGSIATTSQALTIRERFTNDWLTADLNRRSQTVIRPDGEVDWTVTVDYLNQAENVAGIDTDVVKSLKSNAATQNTAQKARDKEALEVQQETDREAIYDLINKNSEDAVRTIESSSLSQKEQQSLRGMIGKDVPIDWPEYNRIADMIDQVALGNVEKQTAVDAIAEGVGKFFDTTAATSLRNKLSEKSISTSPTNSPVHTRGIAAIEEIFDANIAQLRASEELTFESESRILRRKQTVKNEFDKWAIEKPRTDEESEKKIQSLTRIPAEAVVLGFFKRLVTPSFARETTLQSERFKVFKKDPIFDTLSESDIEKAKTAFRLGKSLDEVLQAFGG